MSSLKRMRPTGAGGGEQQQQQEEEGGQSELSDPSSSTGAANFPSSLATPFTTTSSVRPSGRTTNHDQSSRFDNLSRPSSSIQQEGGRSTATAAAAASKWSDGVVGGGGSRPSSAVGPTTTSSSVFNLLFTPGSSSSTATDSRVDTSQEAFARPSGRAPRSSSRSSLAPTPAATNLFAALTNETPRLLAAPYFSPLPATRQQSPQQSPQLFGKSPYANSLPPPTPTPSAATPGAQHRGPPVITPRLTAGGGGGRLTVGTPSVSATPRTGQSRPRRDDNVIVGNNNYLHKSYPFCCEFSGLIKLAILATKRKLGNTSLGMYFM